ncbi:MULTISPECIES: hypothetical protein [Acidovorax]|jgi:hypothetical protein|nr:MULTISPECIES: hypothetical protein [Acidovorax]
MQIAQDSGNPATVEPTFGYGEKFKKKVPLAPQRLTSQAMK